MTEHTTLLRGAARENDALDGVRAEQSCSMGVGCGTAGACYAKAHGRPEECPNAPDVPQVIGRVPRLHPGAKRGAE